MTHKHQAKVLEALQSLSISDTPPEWTNEVWEQNFCEGVTLPVQVERKCLLNEANWAKLVGASRYWLEAEGEGQVENEDDESDYIGYWTTLMDADVSHKTLMALIYCLLERTKQRPLDRICAVHAAQLYLIILQLPGSGAFKIFHSMIFQRMLDTFHLFSDQGVTHARKSTHGSSSTSGVGVASRRGKRKRPLVEEEEDDDDAFGEGGEVVMEGGRESYVNGLLKQLIKDLHNYLKTHSLSEYEVTRYQLVQVLLKMTRTELSSNTQLKLDQLDGAIEKGGAPMWACAWACLDALCQPLHGAVNKTVLEVFRQLLPLLLMMSLDGGVSTSSTLPAHLVTSSQHTLTFVCHIVSCYGDKVTIPLKTLVQHTCTKVPDKAEYRSKMAQVISKLLSLFSDEAYSQLLDWVYKFSRNTKISYRVFALDLISELLTSQRRTPPEGSLSGETEYRLTYKFLVKMVLSRCSDKAPSVRGRALVCLASAASSESSEVTDAVKKSVFFQTTIDPLVAPPTFGDPLELVILQMVRRRATDGKVGVRKAALQALESLIRLNPDVTRKEDVGVVYERCLDPALSVRKQAIVSLTMLTVERMDCTMLHRVWLDGVLPMVMDREVGAQEKCLQLLEDVILNNITTPKRSTSEAHHFAWKLLSLIASEESADLRRYLSRVMELWSKAKKLTPALVNALCSHTEEENHLQASWLLLAEVSQFSVEMDSKFIYDNWQKYSGDVTVETGSPLIQILITIGNVARRLSRIAVEDIRDEIIVMLKKFEMDPSVIQAAVNTLCQICTTLSTKDTYQSSLNNWCVPLLQSCEQYISSMLHVDTLTKEGESEGRSATPPTPEINESEAIRYLFTLGEVAQLSPAQTSHHLCRMVQSLLLVSSPDADISESTSTSRSGSGSTSHQLSSLSGLSLSPALRAHTFITLGKLCLQKEDLAKKSIVHMVRELESSKHPAIRNNIIVVLCDLAVRYSTKVDPYISNISACLRDQSLLVRKQTLTLLARLLQEDYVKWRGSLFFRFVSTLVDKELCQFGEFCLVHLLLVRQPTIFFQHFVECIFHFNSYEKHKVYNQFKQTEKEKTLFSLKGIKNADKRMTLYTFLLSHMADEHRFQLTAKLCQDVLGGVVDGMIPLDDDSVGVVKDTLAVLACKEIKLSSLRRNVGEELADEGDQVGAAVATAQTKIISQIVKKNTIENIVPIVISMKHLLEQKHSPLLKDLLLCLKEIMQDYRNEVGEILVADKQLAEEIEFDLKKLDEEQKKAAAAKAAAIDTQQVITPHAQMVSPLLSPRVLGSAAVRTTVTATPPKLRTGCGQTPQHTPLSFFKGKTPLKVKVAVSPLLSRQIPAKTGRAPPKTPLATIATTTAKTPLPNFNAEQLENVAEGVSSPAAAKARTTLVNSSFVPNIRTPVSALRKTPHIPLQRAVLLTAARKTGRVMSDTPSENAGRNNIDETVLEGRAASTPQGLAESISFNVSSAVPPSPIPATSSLDCYTTRATRFGGAKSTRRSTRKNAQPNTAAGTVTAQDSGKDSGSGRPGRKRVKTAGVVVSVPEELQQGTDISMIPPSSEPQRLDKWKIAV